MLRSHIFFAISCHFNWFFHGISSKRCPKLLVKNNFYKCCDAFLLVLTRFLNSFKEEPAEPALDPGESGVDDILSKLGELDDPENAPKKKEKKSDDEEEDKSGMDDVLGKLDEL